MTAGGEKNDVKKRHVRDDRRREGWGDDERREVLDEEEIMSEENLTRKGHEGVN